MLESYLPPAADPAVVERAVADAIAETGATSPKDMGRVMKAAMAKLAGQTVDGKAVNELVRKKLRRLVGRARRTGWRVPPGLAGAATLASRLLGLVRETVLAAYFGAGNEMDAYLVAFRIPNLVRDLFAEGAMSAAFVPTFTRHLTLHGKADAWRLGNNVITALALVTGALVRWLGIIFAPADRRRLRQRLQGRARARWS